MAGNLKVAYYKRIRAEFDGRMEQINRGYERRFEKAANEYAEMMAPWAQSLDRDDMLEIARDSEIPFEQKLCIAGAYAVANDVDVSAITAHIVGDDDVDEIEKLIALAFVTLTPSGSDED